MFIKAALDTTLYGPKVHTTYLLGKEPDEDQTDGEDRGECSAINYQCIANCSSEVSPTASLE